MRILLVEDDKKMAGLIHRPLKRIYSLELFLSLCYTYFKWN